jgi:hypothetical protein
VNVHNAFEQIHIECCWSILSCAYYTLYCIMNVVKKTLHGFNYYHEKRKTKCAPVGNSCLNLNFSETKVFR